MDISVPKCPLCNNKNVSLHTISKDYQNENNQMEYKAFRCSDCNVVFQYPFPKEEDFNEIYSEDYYAHTEEDNTPILTKLLSSLLQGKKRIFSPLKHSIYPYFDIIKNAEKVLDIGCGKGLFLDVLKAQGKKTYGLEPDTNAVKILKQKGHHAIQGNISASTYDDNYFDLITMFQVFEHIEDPASLLKEVYRILKPGGSFILETPNSDSNLAANKNFWRALEFPRHLILHSPKSIKELLTKTGFQSDIFVRVSPTDIKETFFLKKEIKSVRSKSLYSKLLLPYIIFQYLFNAKEGSLLIAIAKK